MVTPTTGLLAASAMPRAAESPTRKPVKLPGPVVTAMRSRSAKAMPDCFDDARDQRHQRFGMAALHGLRFLRDQLAGLGVEHAGGAGIQRSVDGEDQHAGSYISLLQAVVPTRTALWREQSRTLGAALAKPLLPHCGGQAIRVVHPSSGLHRPDFDHVGHEMPQQVLDAVLQRRGG